jgi:CHASE3 domain sensor protein
MSAKTKSLEQRLATHPELTEHLLKLLELAESDIDSADRVEELAVEGIKELGLQVIQDWAQGKAEEKSQVLREQQKAASPNGKKN